MPGMMDTILNIGLTEATFPGMVTLGGARFAEDCRSRLRAMFVDIVGTPPPDDPWLQLLAAIKRVYHSLDNPRARNFRDWSGLDHALGTAVTIQSMVYGNRGVSSGTGVARSCDVNCGDRLLCGEYLPNEFNDSQSRGAAYVCAREDLNWIESRCNAFAGSYLLPQIAANISRLDIADQAGFFHHAANIFRKGHWEIAFCGEPWAIIADIVAAYLEGVIPDDTTFVDQTFNLQHHGGRLFDKHPLVKNEYSNETVLRGQLNANLNAASIEDLFVTVCLPSPCDTGLGFMFEPSEDVMGVWRRGVQMGLWKVRPQSGTEALTCTVKCEKLHQPHRCAPVKVGPFTVYAAGIHDLGTGDLDPFKTDTDSVLVLLSGDQLEWHCNAAEFTVLAEPLVDLGGVPEDWGDFIRKLFDLLVAGKRLLIACSKGHGRTGCCIASLIAFVESGERTPDPIAAVRQRHCREAVETRKQAEAVFAVRGEPLPTRYWPQFPERKNQVAYSHEASETEFAP